MRYNLSGDDVILRGCEREPPRRLLESMRAHYFAPDTRAEWGLSVAAVPGADEAAVLKAARQIRQSHYRVAVVADVLRPFSDQLRLTGEPGTVTWVQTVWDHNAHGLLVTREEPTMELASYLAGIFGTPRQNPYHAERKRKRAGR